MLADRAAIPAAHACREGLAWVRSTLDIHHRDPSEEAIQAVAESPQGTPSSSTAETPLADFGANEWLVDEMCEQYQQDPDSVDKVWWDFFEAVR